MYESRAPTGSVRPCHVMRATPGSRADSSIAEYTSSISAAPDVADVADVARLDLPRQEPVAYLTQTTLSLDETADVIAALQERFDHLRGPG